MTFNVTLNFKRGASFGPLVVEAPSKERAIHLAAGQAKLFGFDEPVKKAVAVPA